MTRPSNECLRCPFCGGVIGVLNRIPGYPRHVMWWSDMTVSFSGRIAEPSPVQFCPHCGKFFGRNDLPRLGSSSHQNSGRGKSDCGVLSLRQGKAAIRQFLSDPLTDPESLLEARIIVLQRYNDRVRSERELGGLARMALWHLVGGLRPSGFLENATSIVEMDIVSPYLKAEALRELGRFEECLETLERVPKDDLWFRAVPYVRRKAELKDPVVFAIPEVAM